MIDDYFCLGMKKYGRGKRDCITTHDTIMIER
jgi:hypothetical protein